MKELSIEEKAKRYDEAIEKLRNFYRDYDTVSCLIDVKEELANLFPELKESKESDDERIRKHLITLFKNEYGENSNARFAGIKVKDIIAWLEKQGEKKPAEWSKEDERNFDVIYGIIYNSCNAEDASRLLTWFKAIKDRVQPKQEWSNWDKTIIESIEALCDEKIESVVFQDVKEHVNDIKDWLKSLRPQKQWKPSKEQLNGLKEAIEFLGCTKTRREQLQSLYEQLKKLREE